MFRSYSYMCEHTAKDKCIRICWISERKVGIDDTRQTPGICKKKWNREFWARGYYVVTVGNVNESTIVNYIREQEENDKLEK